jgi:hypothetical protein
MAAVHARCVWPGCADHCAVCADPWPCRTNLLAQVDDLSTRLARVTEELSDETARAVIAEQERDDLAALIADARPYTLAEASRG